jgi:hypothetical protein
MRLADKLHGDHGRRLGAADASAQAANAALPDGSGRELVEADNPLSP